MTNTARQLLPRAERQKTILDGAAAAFARRGYAATSMSEVAAASGITKLIVYRHFASKSDLYRAILDRTFEVLAKEFSERVRRAERGAGVRAVLHVARARPEALRLLLVHAPREQEFAEYAARIRQRAVDAVLRGMTRSRDPVLARWSAQLSVTYVFEAVLAWLDVGEPERDEEFARRCTAGLVSMFEGWRRAVE